MGMAASQARLLSITARMSDNEQSGQQLSYAKERLADRTDQVTKEYNEALKATKLQIMTGYSDGAASYTDISFKSLTSPQVISQLGRQYIVTDKKGKVLVASDVAIAFQEANGNMNKFLGKLGYAVSDIDPTIKSSSSDDGIATKQSAIVEKIHEAWDKYFHSVGLTETYGEENKDHRWVFQYFDNSSTIGDGYVTISTGAGISNQVLNFEGTNEEQLKLYNYAMSITESYYSETHNFENIITDSTDGSTVGYTGFDKSNSSMLNYYQNLYTQMLTSGFYSYTNTPSEAANDPEHWLYDHDLYKGASASTTDGTPLQDSNTFEEYLRNGDLLLMVYSKADGKFVSSSISEDTCVQEVEDETKIAAAEAKYTDDLAQIQRLDSRYDLQMKQLDTEHNTLQTEYESVKNVISKNVEKSFSTFG